MAPPLRAAPRRSTTTGGSALFSSSTSSKESIREAFNLRQFAVSHEPDIAFLLQFRPPSSSSSQTEHTTGFLMFVRTSDAISFLLVRPNHQILLRPEPSAMDVSRGWIQFMQSRTKINKSSAAQLIRHQLGLGPSFLPAQPTPARPEVPVVDTDQIRPRTVQHLLLPG
ncbi:uncharacterized protein [Lolium perenne]|uniref:uncharacterized protein isoform X3 n=1 Tax=Lolium perenne TaxID=4522 RepID=UPI003A9A2B48